MAVPARSRAAVPPSAQRIPRSCSDVFRLWASVGLGLVLSLVFDLSIDGLEAVGLRQAPTGEKFTLEYDFGAQLIGWITFALVYLVLGVRAFGGVDRAELVRRVKGSPLPRGHLKRYLLAGGSGRVWAVIVTIFAFSTIVTAAQQRQSSTGLVVGLIVATVVMSWLIITFVFALHYARHDIELGGLDFAGDEEPVFSDYVYLAIACSATFGTTDTTIVTSAMRRTVSLHGVIAFFLNTVVIAVLLSLLV